MKLTKQTPNERKGERGAALITALLVSTLLLAFAGAVIVTTGMSATTSVESTSEVQAYYGAESGLEATLDVMRGNVAHSNGVPNGTLMGFRNAVDTAKSNQGSDHSATSRLSAWLPYGNDNLVTPAGANFAYSVVLTDPDDPNGTIRAASASYRPKRVLVQSTGYGPKGSVKRMEMVVEKTSFEFDPNAMLLMRGADDGSTMSFDIGSSNAKFYTGHDNAGVKSALPTFGVTTGIDLTAANAAITKGSTVEDIKTAQIPVGSLPSWLQNANTARTFLNNMQAISRSMGRYYTSFSGTSGSATSPVFTFVNGNCTLDGGAGLLIVTGDLTLSGNPSFDGVILVLGNGNVNRNGGGNGNILGSIYIASFARSWPSSENAQAHNFRTPIFNTNGGGNSDLRYDSTWVQKAKDALGDIVRDVREY
jgi:hypothetical protein